MATDPKWLSLPLSGPAGEWGKWTMGFWLPLMSQLISDVCWRTENGMGQPAGLWCIVYVTLCVWHCVCGMLWVCGCERMREIIVRERDMDVERVQILRRVYIGMVTCVCGARERKGTEEVIVKWQQMGSGRSEGNDKSETFEAKYIEECVNKAISCRSLQGMLVSLN